MDVDGCDLVLIVFVVYAISVDLDSFHHLPHDPVFRFAFDTVVYEDLEQSLRSIHRYRQTTRIGFAQLFRYQKELGFLFLGPHTYVALASVHPSWITLTLSLSHYHTFTLSLSHSRYHYHSCYHFFFF